VPVPESEMVVEPPAEGGAGGASIAGVAAAGAVEGAALGAAAAGAGLGTAAAAAAVFCLFTTHN
jgi:hypothetical protein